ncbi:MAG: hypothetical protein ISS14_03755 [Actinobacteria bacterium]|nr:hypothetical protein [Actinomycetota bacterium]MBL7123987.1 hypothetical protein [Actinomycetota bacterium]
MALFRRKKKVGRPKNPLGYTLYQYDNIIRKDLKKIIAGMLAKKKLDTGKTSIILEDTFSKFDTILDDLAKENLKIDYRSDKIRYMIVDMINKLKSFFNKAKTHDFNPLEIEKEKDEKSPGLGEIMEMREVIKVKMKDIESDYF